MSARVVVFPDRLADRDGRAAEAWLRIGANWPGHATGDAVTLLCGSPAVAWNLSGLLIHFRVPHRLEACRDH